MMVRCARPVETAELGIGIPTVGTYVRRIYDKLHVYSRAQAIAKFNEFRQAGPPA